MGENIINMPQTHQVGSVRRDLAKHLRMIADGIENDGLETEPHAFLLVLTGLAQHEVLYAGYSQDAQGFHGALSAADAMRFASYRTRGGNVRRREGGRYGGAYDNPNIIEFGLPRARTERRP